MPRAGRGMLLAAVVIVSVAGCSSTSVPAATKAPAGSVSAIGSPPTSPAGSASPVGTAAPPQAVVPAGFPLPAGAVVLPLVGGNAEVAGRWSVPFDGAATYDFFLASLPAHGFEVSGRFPGGGGAVITFRDGVGGSWQLTIEGMSPSIVELHRDPG